MGFLTSVSSGNTSYEQVPSYNMPAFTPAPKVSFGAAPTYQAPAPLNLPTFESPVLREYQKTLAIPGVTIAMPGIDKQFIREQTQELASPALAEERMGLQTALMEARRYSDNPAIISKIVREMMASRGTGLSKILGASGQTASQMEAGNRAQQINVDTNNANLAQARNVMTAQAGFEATNKEIAEANQRLYGEKQDAYQKAVQDLLNQRNAASTYNNQANLSKYTMEGQGNMASQMADWNMKNQALLNKSNMEYTAAAAYNNDRGSSGGSGGASYIAPKPGSIGYPGDSWTSDAYRNWK